MYYYIKVNLNQQKFNQWYNIKKKVKNENQADHTLLNQKQKKVFVIEDGFLI